MERDDEVSGDNEPPVPEYPVPGLYTAREAFAERGVNDTDNFEGRTQAQRLAEDIFSDEFETCMDPQRTGPRL